MQLMSKEKDSFQTGAGGLRNTPFHYWLIGKDTLFCQHREIFFSRKSLKLCIPIGNLRGKFMPSLYHAYPFPTIEPFYRLWFWIL